MKINLKSELKQATSVVTDVQKAIPKGIASALNRVAQGIGTVANKEVRKTYQIRARDVRAKGNIKISSRASMTKLNATLRSTGGNIPLINFSTNPSSTKRVKLVRAAIKRGPKKPVPGAFVTSLGTHGVSVFRRTGPARRDPAEQLYGPPVPIMLEEKGVNERVESEAQQRMQKRMNHEINRALGRLKIK